MTAEGLLGTAVHVGPDAVGAVTGVLVDTGRAPVLLRVHLFDAGGTAFVPWAAVDRSPSGVHARSSHVLLQRGEASFYEERGLAWLPHDDDLGGDVSTVVRAGMVTPRDDRQRNRLLRDVHT